MTTWLDEHLETFVRPVLKQIPNIDPKDSSIQMWTPRMVTCLEAVWKQAKKRSNGRKILLAGRDTWEFEILARLEGVETDFRPDISTGVATAGLKLDKSGIRLFDRDKPHPLIPEDYSEHYLLDSGYKGTIPRALGVKNWDMVSLSPASLGFKDPNEQQKCRDEHQVFPRALLKTHNKAGQPMPIQKYSVIYNLISPLEGSPKYWQSGLVSEDKKTIVQKLATNIDLYNSTSPFMRAAGVTQHIVKNLRFVKPRVWIDMKVASIMPQKEKVA